MAAACTKNNTIEFTQDELDQVVSIFKALADATRLRVLSILTKEEQLCVSDIADTLDMSISRVSHHLGILNKLGFVKAKHEGKQVYHRIHDPCIIDIMKRSKEHVSGT
ncbi:MAG: ArsR/SmtB family transcription factor [Candidatus Thorarchaeota archaeon]